MTRLVSILLVFAAPSLGQAPSPGALESIASGQRPLIRARAMHCYKMPDGQIWDGWAYFEQRKIIDYTVKAFDRVEPGQGVPGQTLVEDHVIGTVWKVKPTREALAWGLSGCLA